MAVKETLSYFGKVEGIVADKNDGDYLAYLRRVRESSSTGTSMTDSSRSLYGQ